MTDKKATGKDKPTGDGTGEHHKPYRIKPAEVYAEPNPGVCTRGKTK